MLTSNNTEQRILDLMKCGAKLVYHYYYVGYDGYSFLTEITLDHNGYSLKLTEPPTFNDEGDAFPPACPIAEQIIQRADTREGYAGYHSEYAKNWRRVYEHTSAPVPRWVTEQWGIDNDGNLVSPHS